jgi:hypothetical protein
MAGYGNDSDGYVGLSLSTFAVVSGTNLGIGTSTQFGSAEAVLAMANVSTAPSSLGFAGGLLYVQSGHLWFLGTGGTLTQVASA